MFNQTLPKHCMKHDCLSQNLTTWKVIVTHSHIPNWTFSVLQSCLPRAQPFMFLGQHCMKIMYYKIWQGIDKRRFPNWGCLHGPVYPVEYTRIAKERMLWSMHFEIPAVGKSWKLPSSTTPEPSHRNSSLSQTRSMARSALTPTSLSWNQTRKI